MSLIPFHDSCALFLCAFVPFPPFPIPMTGDSPHRTPHPPLRLWRSRPSRPPHPPRHIPLQLHAPHGCGRGWEARYTGLRILHTGHFPEYVDCSYVGLCALHPQSVSFGGKSILNTCSHAMQMPFNFTHEFRFTPSSHLLTLHCMVHRA